MKLALSRIVMVAAAAGMLAATAAPASAWVCTARNARGVHFTAVGVFPPTVCERALFKCRVNSFAPRTCRIVRSHP